MRIGRKEPASHADTLSAKKLESINNNNEGSTMNKYTTCLRGRVPFMSDAQLRFVFGFIKQAMIDRGFLEGKDNG